MEYYTLVVPLKLNDDDTSFLKCFNIEVWICCLMVTPIAIMAMGLLDYIFCKKVKWTYIVDFVTRSAVSQSLPELNAKENYQKAFSIIWLLSALVLTFAYKGSLMAMITRPSLHLPINSVDEMLGQTEISWVTEPGTGIVDYMSDSPPGSTMRRLLDGVTMLDTTIEWPNGCYDEDTFASGKFASICDSVSIKALIHDDFSENARCNYYYVKDFLSVVPSIMAFQVSLLEISIIMGWEAKRLKGCVFSPPSFLPVPGRGKEAEGRREREGGGGCVKLVKATRGSQEAGFVQPLTEAFATAEYVQENNF